MDKIKITNFRKIKESWELDLAPITFFTGKNNSGKSSVLKALMVLSDYTNSNNFFEMGFLGRNSRNHKIQSYSNAINWENNTKDNLLFEWEFKGLKVEVTISPYGVADNDSFLKGELKNLEVTRIIDNSKFEIKRTSADNYDIIFNSSLLEKNNNKKSKSNIQNLRRTKYLLIKQIEEKEKEIKSKFGITGSIDALGLLAFVPIVGTIGAAAATAIGAAGGVVNKKTIDLSTAKQLGLKNDLEKLQEKLKSIEALINKSNIELKNSSKGFDFTPSIDLNKYYGDLTLGKIIKNTLLPYFRSNEKKLGKFDEKDESIKLAQFCDELIELFQFSVDHLSPHRYNQDRLIMNNNPSNDISEIMGDHLIRPMVTDSEGYSFIQKWMPKFDIGTDFKISEIQGQAGVVEVSDSTGGFINISDKGFGAGQIFSILLKIGQKINEQKINLSKFSYFPYQNRNSRIILIEEPEANLHPGFQSELANLFYEANKEHGIRFIIETHSEYLIRKSQFIVVDKELEKEKEKINPFKVYYFEKDGQPYEMKYKEDGGFDKTFGPDFLDVTDNIALDMFLKNNGGI